MVLLIITGWVETTWVGGRKGYVIDDILYGAGASNDEQHRCMGLNSHGVSKVSVVDAADVKQVRAVIECLRQQMRELIWLREK